jgi:tryptophanase
MNYHFTTTKTHIQFSGGSVVELFTDEAVKITSDCPFKGNIDIVKYLLEQGADKGVFSFEKKTALDYAYEKNHKEIIELLKG